MWTHAIIILTNNRLFQVPKEYFDEMTDLRGNKYKPTYEETFNNPGAFMYELSKDHLRYVKIPGSDGFMILDTVHIVSVEFIKIEEDEVSE